jgi:hypothetical protein
MGDPSKRSFKEKRDYFEKLSRAKKDADKKPKTKAGKKRQKCPRKKKVRIKLVELVEIVERSGTEGTVGGVGMASSDPKFKEITRRTTESGQYRQYINFGKDLDGADKRHPECDRFIEFRARIEREDGKKEGLAGKKVHWSYVLTSKGDHRNAQLKTGQADLHKDDNAYIKGGQGPKKDKLITRTNGKGWTNKVKVYLSKYGGDQYTIKAQADKENKGSPSGKTLEAGAYVVWRKFWYQNTVRKGASVPDVSQSQTAYGKVCANMVAARKKTVQFDKEALNKKEANIADRTIYKEFMFKVSGSNAKDVVVIGRHNEKAIRKFFVAEAKEPVKAHLMFCDYQWDPQTTFASETGIVIDRNPSSEICMANIDTSNVEGIVSPALQGLLVHAGSSWQAVKPGFWAKTGEVLRQIFTLGLASSKVWLKSQSGTFQDNDVVIDPKRTDLNCVKVRIRGLAKGRFLGKVKATLKLSYAEGFLGDNDGYQNTIVMGRPGTSSTVSHEIGHGFHQTPRSSDADVPKSLKVHPNQYMDYGSHCNKGATPDGTKYQSGPCIMATRSNKINRTYCDVCQPYIRLQDMTQMENPSR